MRMGNPADPRTVEATVRLFTPAEANALVPAIETVLRRMDPKLAREREIDDLLGDLESYWGPDLTGAGDEDAAAHARLAGERASLHASLEADLEEILSNGVEVKDVRMGLVDFYAKIGGSLAYLCWQRGEPRVAHWHSLDGGFAARKTIDPKAWAEP